MTFAAGLLVKEESPSKADAILVLGGDGFGTRILKGAELGKVGYAPVVWVSAGVDTVGCASDATIVFANRHGYPASMFRTVSLPRDADSTRGEAIFIGKQFKTQGIHKILLVTSNYHTSRATYLWHKEDPWLHVVTVAAPDPDFTPSTWWKTRAGQKTFLLEWTKTVASRLGD